MLGGRFVATKINESPAAASIKMTNLFQSHAPVAQAVASRVLKSESIVPVEKNPSVSPPEEKKD